MLTRTDPFDIGIMCDTALLIVLVGGTGGINGGISVGIVGSVTGLNVGIGVGDVWENGDGLQ